MSRTQTTRRLSRLASAAICGVLAATCLVPSAASADAPPAIDGWTRGSDNGALAFSVNSSGAPASTIWPDGTRKTAITQAGNAVGGGVSAWSADGNRVLLAALGGKSIIDANPWTSKLVETVTDPILSANRYIQGPSLSPDGLTYAWGTTGDGLHVGNPYDGVEAKWPHNVAGTAWSKADRLAWINDDRDPGENDDPGVYVFNGASNTPPDSAHLAFLSDEDNGETPMQVSMSADGSRLAYSMFNMETTSYDIRVSSAENSSASRDLETGGAPGSDERYASISPDGTKVAFASDRGGAWAIWTAKWDGTDATIVPNTTLPAGQEYIGLAWQPSQVPDLNETHISSATEVGSTLKLDIIGEQGTAPLVRTYKWQRCDDGTPASCVDTGVTTEGFPVDASHVGHRFRVVRTVTNPAGADTLESEITTPIVAPDTEAPKAPNLYGRPASPSRSTVASFGWNGAEPGGTFACSLDEAAFEPCTTADDFPLSGDGPHRFRVRQVDAASNQGEIAEHLWTLDTTAPSKPTIGTKPASVTKEQSAEITFSGDETDGTFECRIADGSWDSCPSPLKRTNLTDGEQRVSIRQLDQAGNPSDPVEVKWTVDSTVPTQPVVTTDLSAVRTTSTVEIAFTGEVGATFSCSVDHGAFAPCTSPAKLQELGTGPHHFAVRQTDAAGNPSTPREVDFTVDVTGPAEPTFTDTPKAAVNTPRVVFAFTGADADGTGFECAIDGIPGWAPCQSGDDVDGLPEGTYTFRVRQLDAHGTPGEAASYTWKYDATKPVAPTLKGDLDVVRTKETTLGFTGEGDAGKSTFECRLDKHAWAACESPATLQGYGAGPHTFAVREIDAAGNVGEVAEDAWTADFSGPAAPTPTPVETPAPGHTPVPEQSPVPERTPAAPTPAPTPAPAADQPATTTPAKAATPAPAAQPKLSAVIGGTPERGTGAGGTSSAATITVKRDGVGVGCAITGTVLTSCKVDLYVAAATGRAAGATPRQILVGTGEYRAKAGSRKMEVEVTLNATGRKLLRSAPEGLKVAVAITGRPATGQPLKATGAATLVLQRTAATVGGFAVNSATLTQAARRQLTALANRVRGTAVSLRVVGHTDGSTTDADYLKGLGLRRAQTVAAFLRAHGVKAKAALTSQGAKQPRATNATKAGRALNRRVELRIDR